MALGFNLDMNWLLVHTEYICGDINFNNTSLL